MQQHPTLRPQTRYALCFLWSLCFVLLGLWMPNPAQAQERDAYERELRTLYAEGKTFAEKQEYKQALIKFKAALGLFDQMNVVSKKDAEKQALFQRRKMLLYTIGRTYQYDKQWNNAYKYYRDCLKENPEDKVKQLIQKHLQTLQPYITGDIEIESTPSQATVQLRDEWGQVSTGQTPFKLKTPAGAYTLTLQKDGYATITKTLQLRNGATLQTQYSLSSSRTALTLQSNPSGAQVKIIGLNGQEYNGTTPFQKALPPGRYEISIQLAQHQEKRFFVTLKSGTDFNRQETLARIGTSVAPPLRTRRNNRRRNRRNRRISTQEEKNEILARRRYEAEKKQFQTIATVLGTAAGVFLAISAVTWLAGNIMIGEVNSKAGDYNLLAQNKEIYENAKTSDRLRVTTYVMLAFSGASLITSIVFAAMSNNPPPTALESSRDPNRQMLYLAK